MLDNIKYHKNQIDSIRRDRYEGYYPKYLPFSRRTPL